MSHVLEGKVAIVTGAGRGIGRGEALELARQGAAVVVNDLGGSSDGTGEQRSEADDVSPRSARRAVERWPTIPTSSTMMRARRWCSEHWNEFGRVDTLVNHAGNLRDRMIFNMSEEDWDSVVAVHLKRHFNITRHVSPLFRQQRSGVIVNTGSESGLGRLGQANYSAAKEGIVGLTQTTARDLGKHGVRCNAIRPRAATRLTISDEMRAAAESAIDHLDDDPVPERTLYAPADGWSVSFLAESLPRTAAQGLRNRWVPRE